MHSEHILEAITSRFSRIFNGQISCFWGLGGPKCKFEGISCLKKQIPYCVEPWTTIGLPGRPLAKTKSLSFCTADFRHFHVFGVHMKGLWTFFGNWSEGSTQQHHKSNPQEARLSGTTFRQSYKPPKVGDFMRLQAWLHPGPLYISPTWAQHLFSEALLRAKSSPNLGWALTSFGEPTDPFIREEKLIQKVRVAWVY